MELEKDGFGRDIIRLKNLFIRELDSLNYSKNTISTYNQQLLVFGDFCEEISDEVGLKDIKQMHISYFFSWLNERIKPKNATKASYYRTLKSFFNFLTKNNDDFIDFDYLFKNFSLKLKKGENKEINFIKSTDIDKILKFLQECIKNNNNYKNNRNSLLVKLLFGAGLRISEALNLRIQEFTTNNANDEFYTLNITAKGGERQKAYIIKSLIHHEFSYISQKLSPDDYIFLTSRDTQLKRQTAYINLKRIYELAGVFQKKGCHILRHSFAMDLMAKDVNLGVIQKALRHKNINTTMIYADGTPEMIKEALKK